MLLAVLVLAGVSQTARFEAPTAALPGSTFVQSAVTPLPATNTTTYNVTIHPTGLPAVLQWAVAVDGGAPTFALGKANVTKSLVNGTHRLVFTGSGSWAPTPTNLNFTVNGAAQTVLAVFSEQYTLNFSEVNLPVGNHSRWHVFIQYLQRNANAGQTIQFQETNGTYQVSAGASLPWTAVPQTESINVNGSPLAISFAFFPPATLYSVTFAAFGLPTNAAWTVTVDGRGGGVATSPTTYSFTESNGTHVYAAGGPTGYDAIPSAATFTVNGANLTVPVRFAPPSNYSVTFVPEGLGGAAWQVTLTGIGTLSSAGGAPLADRLVNGSYPFTIPPVGGLSPFPDNGSIWVAGGNVTVTIVFVGHEGPVIFTELGLATGAWWVTINGTNHSIPAGASLALELPFGSYAYEAGVNTSAFVMSVPRGNVEVGVQSQVVTLTIFALPGPASTASGSTSLSSELKALLPEFVVVAAGVVLVFAVLVWRRYRPRSPFGVPPRKPSMGAP